MYVLRECQAHLPEISLLAYKGLSSQSTYDSCSGAFLIIITLCRYTLTPGACLQQYLSYLPFSIRVSSLAVSIGLLDSRCSFLWNCNLMFSSHRYGRPLGTKR